MRDRFDLPDLHAMNDGSQAKSLATKRLTRCGFTLERSRKDTNNLWPHVCVAPEVAIPIAARLWLSASASTPFLPKCPPKVVYSGRRVLFQAQSALCTTTNQS